MNVRWSAVLIGVAVDLALTWLLGALALLFGVNVGAEPITFQRTSDIVTVALGLSATLVGGFVAGSVAREDGVINGLMVGVVEILLFALQRLDPAGVAGSHIDVLLQIAGCLAGAAGGYLSRFRVAARPRR